MTINTFNLLLIIIITILCITKYANSQWGGDGEEQWASCVTPSSEWGDREEKRASCVTVNSEWGGGEEKQRKCVMQHRVLCYLILLHLKQWFLVKAICYEISATFLVDVEYETFHAWNVEKLIVRSRIVFILAFVKNSYICVNEKGISIQFFFLAWLTNLMASYK